MDTRRILIVDDEESICCMLNEYFTAIGYEVVVAGDGEDAIEKFVPGKFNCVISDLMMPKIDGLELIKRIRILDDDVVFLIITGSPGINNAMNAIKDAGHAYLIKPFRLEDIRLKVEEALNVKRTRISLKRSSI